MASADFNRDGIADLVVTNVGVQSSEISILLGRGDGTFLPDIRYTSGDGPQAVAIADFNADGRMDLAVANIRSDNVSILPGVGDGTFGPATRINVGDSPTGIVAGDWNGDSHPDLAVANRWTNDFSILLGVGDGTFGPETRHPTDFVPSDIDTADFNADGRPDLSLTAFPDGLAVHLGNGDGTFGSEIRSATSQLPEALAVGDLNGDGVADVATGNYGFPDDVSVLLGIGDGTFLPRVEYPVPDNVNSVAFADLDGDGDLDFAALCGASQGALSIRLGSGNGTFGPEKRFGVGVGARHLTIADLNGDGRPDVAVTEQNAGLVLVLLGVGGGDFGPQPRFKTGTDPGSVAVGDFDVDGHLDLAVANANLDAAPDDVSVLLGRGDGSFMPQVRYPAGNTPYGVAIADFDGDGQQDLATANRGDGDVSVLLGRGDGTFGPQERFPAGTLPECLATGDLNGDGRQDLAVCNGFNNQTVTMLFGLGNGSFGSPGVLQTQASPTSVAIADLTGDGLLDLLISPVIISREPLVGGVELRRGLGGGSFGPPEVSITEFTAGLTVGDLDGDGRLDLAGSLPPRDLVCVVLGNGDGTLASPRCFPAGDAPVAVTAGDIDGDGTQDLVAVNRSFSGSSVASLHPGDGLGGFLPFSRFLAGVISTSVAAADFNEDGDLDLAVTSQTSDEVWILPNQGPLPNRPPMASAGADLEVECGSPAGTLVTLDGSASSDHDSTAGTNDDIVLFEWFEGFGGPSQFLLGTGGTLGAALPLGTHLVTLRVADRQGLTDTDETVVDVVDTAVPALSVSLAPSRLWPPNHRMIEVTAQVPASDLCGGVTVLLISVASSEPDDAPGAGDGRTTADIQDTGVGTPDFQYGLRAERDAAGGGRTYVATYQAGDPSGNVATATGQFFVPYDQEGVVDPLVVTLSEGPAGTLISWSEVSGAHFYGVARGDLADLKVVGESIDLGALTCIAERTTGTNTVGSEDAKTPPVGAAFFYVVQYDDGLPSSFGTESAPVPRTSTSPSGGCL